MPRYQRSMCMGGQDNGLCEGSGRDGFWKACAHKCEPAWAELVTYQMRACQQMLLRWCITWRRPCCPTSQLRICSPPITGAPLS